MDTLQSTVRSYVLGQFLPDANGDELTASTPLIAGGILDSLATVRLVMFLEQHYGIQVQAHEVSAENLDTLERIANLVRSKKSAGAGGTSGLPA